MASAAPARAARPAPPRSARLAAAGRRLVPGEGWTTVLLHALLVLTAAWTVRRAEWSPPLSMLTLVAAGGFGFGLLLAKAAVVDLIAHLSALWFGLAAVLWLTVGTLDQVAGGRRERLRYLVDLGREWYRRTANGRSVDEADLFVVVIGLTVWLVAYTSAWVLYRRGWLTTALVLPGIIVVINLGYAPEAGTRPLVVFLIAACVLAARHHAFRRERDWARARMLRPSRLPWRFVAAGANLALLAAVLAWTLPTSARATLFEAVWDQIEEPWASVERRWEQLAERIDRDGGSAPGSYAAFGESFELGGPLNLGDGPVALLQGDQPTYLVAHRYDRYDGHGWASDVEATFDPVAADGKRYSSQMTFAAGQGIHLSPQVMTARRELPSRLTILNPKDELLFTTDTHLSVENVRTSVQLSWRPLADERIAVQSVPTGDVPPDLRQLVNLLRDATFSPGGGPAPAPLDPATAEEIRRERRELADRFLSTAWEVGPDGRATILHVSGQIPVYDDVEAVFALEPPEAGDGYDLRGLVSQAGPGELREAGTAYPGHVTARYLQQPDTVTERTRRLAGEVTAGLETPFDQALAVQDYLRDAIKYEENIEAPPANQDVVDFVLFDSREGYCEYYASAMTVMLRSLGVPARIAVGFFPVSYDPERGGFLYRERNAHAWVEVYFPGYGWIPFEPTQSQRPLDYGGSPPEPAVVGTPEPAPEPTPAAAPTAVPTVTPPGTTAAPEEPADPSLLDRAPGPLGLATIALGLLVLLGAVAAVALWSWGLRGLSPAGALYSRALRVGRWLGVATDRATTPAEYADRLGRAVPAAAVPARTVADIYAREQYAAVPPDPAETRAGRAAWRQLRAALARSLLRRRRGGDLG